MKLRATARRRDSQSGSILIIVLWIAFGLVSVALYFANSMSLELRAADNESASLEAEQAIEGTAHYVSNVLAHAISVQPGILPDPGTYRSEAVPVGEAVVWLIGRATNELLTAAGDLTFGLVDETAKLNLNKATIDMLQRLPNIRRDLAASIVAWRSSSTNNDNGGAESDTYLRLQPPYFSKNAPFETVDELRLVYGMNLELLYGEDSNLNGSLDPNENDGDILPPYDNRDGRLNSGLLEYVTVYTREPNTMTNGSPRLNVSTLTSTNIDTLRTLLEQTLDSTRADQVIQKLGLAASGGPGRGGGAGGPSNRPPGGPGAVTPTVRLGSLLEFFIRSGLTEEDFAKVANSLTVATGLFNEGLVNVNTASEAVLACIPGISNSAPALVSYRQSNPASLTSVAWVAKVLDGNSAIQAGPYLTASTYQFTADIAAVGHHGRGYRRVRFVFDTSEGTPKILYRQDLTHLGWALGQRGRNDLALARRMR